MKEKEFFGEIFCLRCGEQPEACIKIKSDRASSGSISVFALAPLIFSSLENALYESLEMLMTTGFTLQGRYFCSFMML